MYDSKFKENTLIVGQTGCNKTTFIQNLAKNKIFAKLKEIFWLSKIMLSQDREQDISSCFDLKVNFKYPQTLNDFNMELDSLPLPPLPPPQKKKETDNSIVNNVMDEKNMFNKLIVMDDILGLADRSNDFANFLTVA